MFTRNQQKIIEKVIAALKFSSQNGAIILLACDEEKIRKGVEKCLQQEFTTLSSIYLQEERNNLPAILRKDLHDNAICQVYNLPEVIRAEEAKEPDRVAACLQYLNSDREVFFEKKVVAIFWLDEDTLNKKITWQATDFWAYRTMSAVFRSEEIPERRGQKQKDWLQMVSDKQNLLQEYRHKRPDDKASIAVVLSDLAGALYQTGRLDEALLQYQEALEIDREIGDQQGEASRLGNIGEVYLDLSRTEEALISHQEALKIDQGLGYRQNEAIQLSSIGMVYERLGRIEEALEYHQEALKIDQELGYRQGEAIQLSNIGKVYQNSGKLHDALKYHQKALNIFQEPGYTQDQADQLEEISRIYQNSGQTEDALKYHQQALEIMGVQIDAETEKEAQAAVRLIERQIIPDKDTPVSEYIPQQVSTELPVVRFPGELKRFAETADFALWQNLTEDERYFLSNLAAKLEPIIQIVPSPPIPFVLGFELLALGPNGENFPEVINRTGFDPGLVRLMLAIVALKTAETLRADATFGGQPGARNLLFTINLDPKMLESPHLTTFMDAYNSLLHHVVFEVNEDTSLKHINRIKELVMAHDLKFALDDINALSPDVRQILAKRAELTKVDFKTFSDAMRDVWEKPDEAISTIASFAVKGKPLVVEGLQNETQQRFLAMQWERSRHGQLYGQGLNLSPGQPWDAWLADLKDFGLPGGHILSSPLLAKVNRIISQFLLETKYSSELKRENRGDIFIFQLPGAAVGRGNHITLGLLTERKDSSMIFSALSALPALSAGLAGVDYLIVKEPMDRIGQQIKLEQIPVDQLHSYLSAWRQVHPLGYRVIEDDRTKKYREKEYIPAAIGLPDDSTISCPANGSPEEGRELLFHWLTKTNLPFCALLGDYGMGKTFLCRMFARRLQEQKQQDPDLPAPLYLDMRDLPTWKDEHIPELEEMLWAMTNRAGFSDISIKGILAAVHQGHVILIFDGFDEQAAHLTNNQAISLLRNIRQAVPAGTKGKLLLTCRTHYFLNRPDERGKVRGGAEVRTRDGYSQTDFLFLYLKPFDEKRIRLYLEKVLHSKGYEAFEFLKSVHDLTDLAQRPYLLSLITTHLDRLEALAQEGKRIGAADVYEIAVNEWMDRDVGKHLLFSDLKLKFMEELAWQMWQQAKQELHFSHLRDWLFKQLPGRFPVDKPEELGRVDTDLRTATFLMRDPDGNYCFAHRSFMEFFLARHIARRLALAGLAGQDSSVLDLPRLSKEIIEFAVDLVHHPSFNLNSTQQLICRILESGYTSRVSENALLIKTSWDRLRPESSPAPAAFHLEGADLSGADLSEIHLSHLHLTRANLAGANLTKSIISGNLFGANLTKVKAARSNLAKVSFYGARLDAADFSGANLVGCNLSQAKGGSVFLQHCDLTDALLNNASLPYARLFQANISATQINQAHLFRASMPDLSINQLKPIPQTGHSAYVRSVAFSPDGRLLASGSWDNTVRLWDVERSKEIACLHGHSAYVMSVAFSPDGKLLASESGDRTVRLWDVERGKETACLHGHSNSVSSVSFSPDGKLLASGSWDTTVRLWDMERSKEIACLHGHFASVNSVDFSPDGRLLASGSGDTTVRLWDVERSQEIACLHGHSYYVNSVAFSPDSRLLASGSEDKTVRLWDVERSKEIACLHGHSYYVNSVAFSPDGKLLASGSGDRTVRLWDVERGKEIACLHGHSASVNSVAFSSDGKLLASGSDDKTVRLWDVEMSKEIACLNGHFAYVSSVSFSPDGRLLASGGMDKTVRLWDVEMSKEIACLNSHSDFVNSVDFSPDGRLLASGSGDTTVRLWDVERSKEIACLHGHSNWVNSVAFSPDGRLLASGSRDNTVRLWDVEMSKEIACLHGHSDYVRSVAFSPDGRLLASGSVDKTVRLWDVERSQEIACLHGHSVSVNSVSFSPDGRLLASGSEDSTVRLWDVERGKEIACLNSHSADVNSVSFSPDGRLLASGSRDNTVRLWDVEMSKEIACLHGHSDSVNSVAFSRPDGRLLASGSGDNTVRLWDVDTGRLICTLLSCWGDDAFVVYAPDGIFNASESAMDLIWFADGLVVYPSSEFAHELHRPEKIQARVRQANHY